MDSLLGLQGQRVQIVLAHRLDPVVQYVHRAVYWLTPRVQLHTRTLSPLGPTNPLSPGIPGEPYSSNGHV